METTHVIHFETLTFQGLLCGTFLVRHKSVADSNVRRFTSESILLKNSQTVFREKNLPNVSDHGFKERK